MIQNIEFARLHGNRKKNPALTALPRRKDEPVPLLGDNRKPFTIASAEPRQCRWIGGEEWGAKAAICAHPADGSYCPYHRKRAYVKSVPYTRLERWVKSNGR